MKVQGAPTSLLMLWVHIASSSAAVLYVDLNSTNPVPPYADWNTAAIDIQAAVDAATNGDQIIVAAGVYQSQLAVSPDNTTNRVVVTKAVSLLSVNGSTATAIDGGKAVRCAYLTNGASLTGFTLTNGVAMNGGGVYCQTTNVLISNCVLVNNSARSGGGAYSGTLAGCTLTGNTCPATGSSGGGASGSILNNCTLSGNVTGQTYPNTTGGTSGGGASGSILNNCALSGNKAYGAGASGGGAAGSTLNNCTISGGFADQFGGGAYGCNLTNCVISNNTANYGGGGVSGGSLVNCVLSGNQAGFGGAIYWTTTLYNCTVTGNYAGYGGGGYSCTLHNCINYYNSGGDNDGDTFDYCCTSDAGGVGNITAPPDFADGAGHLQSGSPCINAGNNVYVASTTDLDGDLRLVNGTVDMGAYEFHLANPLTVSVQANYTNIVEGYPVQLFGSYNGGRSDVWSFGDGTVVTNQLSVSHIWAAEGDYTVRLTVYDDNYPIGVSATLTIHVIPPPVLYVNASWTNPVAPYSSWSTAATNIQDAVDTANPGDHILVTNGVYQAGGRVVYGLLTNRLAINKPVLVQSVNGAAVTMIQGNATNSDSAVRCAYLTNGATLSGFTLVNGATRAAGDASREQSGAAAWCESTNALISNCVIVSNTATVYGGGVYAGSLNDCTLAANMAHNSGGGAYASILNHCWLSNNLAIVPYSSYSITSGGGAENCTLTNCTLVRNVADNGGWGNGSWGGGAHNSLLVGCLLLTNSAGGDGGGVNTGTLIGCSLFGNVSGNKGGGAENSSISGCLIIGNLANGWAGGGVDGSYVTNSTLVRNFAGSSGGGAYASVLDNCIVYYNTAPDGDYNDPSYSVTGCTLNNCCSARFPSLGTANITNAPLFMDLGGGDYHLSPGSPCINSGSNSYVAAAADLDGNPRIIDGTVDIGVYEFQGTIYITQQPLSRLAYAGQSITQSVVAASSSALSYQWQADGTNIAGATNATLVFTNVQLTDSGAYSVLVSNTSQVVRSAQAILTVVYSPLVILAQPSDQVVVQGSNAQFSVAAFSPYPSSYQWQLNGTNLVESTHLEGTTNATLIVYNTSLADVGPYRVVITNSYAAATSAVAALTVLGIPTFAIQPSNVVAMVFSPTTITASVTGAPPLFYYWQKDYTNLVDGGNIAGAQTTSLTLSNAQIADAGLYRLVVSNAFGATVSSDSSLTVSPVFIWGDIAPTPPANATNLVSVAAGENFFLGLHGDGTVCAWGDDSTGQTDVPASATNVIAIAAGLNHCLALRQDGSVIGWATTYYGETTPPASATNVVAIAAGYLYSLALRADGVVIGWGYNYDGRAGPPANATNVIAIAAGYYHSLALRQDGTLLSWGWNGNGQTTIPPTATNVVAIAAGFYHSLALLPDGSVIGWGSNGNGQTTPSPDATNLLAIGAGAYHSLGLRADGVILGWGAASYGAPLVPGSVGHALAVYAKDSHNMLLAEDPASHTPPTIWQQPSSRSLVVGQTTILSPYVTGSLPLRYQWYLNGSAVAGQTNNWLALTSIRPEQAGEYQVVVTNTSGSVTSDVAVVTEFSWATVGSQPTNQSAILGSNVTFSVGVYGLPSFGYQWYFGGTTLMESGRISGSTTASLSISNVQAADAGSYSVVITNGSSSVTSSPATLTVLFPATIPGQPTSQSVLVTSNATFTVTAAGTGTINYQWRLNGTNLADGGRISGSGSPTLTISGTQTNDDGGYQVVVANAYGAATSSVANLTVYVPVQITGQPASAAVLVGSNTSFAVSATGTAIGYQWFFDGAPLADDGRISGAGTSTLMISNVRTSDVGGYRAVVSNILSSAASMTASLVPLITATSSVHYVDLNSGNAAPPYLNWPTAAATIQDAIDAAVDGDQILVTNGIYQTGGRVVYGSLTNRVVVNKALTVRSVNGSAMTVIRGNPTQGNSAIRCVYLTNNTALVGFTLSGGATRATGDTQKEQSGGGAWCESTNCVLINCTIISNSASQYGGGAFRGLLSFCVLSRNSAASGGGACSNILYSCTITTNKASAAGGGAFGCSLRSSTVSWNTNSSLGAGLHSCTAVYCNVTNNACGGSAGGAYNSGLTNCTLLNNSGGHGGGAYSCVLSNCTLAYNTALDSIGGGGAYQSTLNVCLIVHNIARSGPGGGGISCVFNSCLISSNFAPSVGTSAYGSSLNNCTVTGDTNGVSAGSCTCRNSILFYNAANYSGGSLAYCCTTPLPAGSGNFTNAPMFVDQLAGNFRLQTNSPCINSGNNLYVTNSTDLDGRSRVVAGTVDRGAYEFQGSGTGEFLGWLQQHGLATDGSADYADSDGDGMNNWQEWWTGTDPNDPHSVLLLMAPAPAPLGVSVSWQSVSNRVYFLQRSADLAADPAFVMLATNIIGQAVTTTYLDTTTTGPGPYFYRLGAYIPAVQIPAAFSIISFAWLQQYGLPTDGTADFVDSDGDGMNNWQEWRAGTNPTNSSSVLKMLPLAATNISSGIKVSWQSVSGVNYYLQRSTNLAAIPPFSTIRSNIAGQAGSVTFTDSTATSSSQYFYRVGVQ